MIAINRRERGRRREEEEEGMGYIKYQISTAIDEKGENRIVNGTNTGSERCWILRRKIAVYKLVAE